MQKHTPNLDMKTHIKKQHCIFYLVALFFGIAIVYFLFLGTYPLLTPDESRYAEIAREMIETKQYIVPHLNYVLYFEKPALFYWIIASALKCFGLHEWSVRFWTVIFAISGCGLTYFAASRWYNRTTAFYATALLATSFLYFIMGHMVALDLPVSIFLTATLVFFYIGVQHPTLSTQKYYFWLSAIMAACAVLTKGLIGIVFPIAIIGTWVLLLNQWRSLKHWPIISSILLFLILALPWHIIMQLRHPAFFNFYIIGEHFLRYSTLEAAHEEPFYFYLGILLVGFLPWSTFLPQAIKAHWPTWKNRATYQTEIFLFAWIFIIFTFFSFSGSKLIPYILPIFPPLSILTGHYFALQSSRKIKGITIGFCVLPFISFAFATYLILLPHYYDLMNPIVGMKFLYLLAIIFTLVTMISLVIYWRLTIKAAFISLNVGSLIFLLVLLLAIPSIDHDSIQSLAVALKPLLTPQDEVINYKRYNQDLPFYLQRRVTLVDWFVNELEFGYHHQDHVTWMIDSTAFWEKFQGTKRIFIVTRVTDLANMRRDHPQLTFYPIAQTQRNVLLSNRPVS